MAFANSGLQEETIALMKARGGAFVKSLAHTWSIADNSNRRTLEHAFARFFTVYQKQAENIEYHRLRPIKDEEKESVKHENE